MGPKKKDSAPIVNGGVRFGRVKNTLKMGIVGLPNIGKSSLFNLLTKTDIAEAQNFPFCTIDPNEARCAVPDERYDFLCDMWNPPSKYPAYLQIWDIAGLIRGASEGDGLGNKFLSHIGAVDGIFHMVRAFENEEVQHVEDTIDPVRDLETITYELCQKDIGAVANALYKEEKDLKRNPLMKLSATFKGAIEKLNTMLKEGRPVKDGDWSTAEIELIKEKIPDLVTTKPQCYIINLTKKDFLRKKNKHLPAIHKWIQEHGGGPMLPVSVEYEEELLANNGKPEEEGQPLSVIPKLITEGFKALELIFFITAGDKEVRCWTIQRGWAAPQAAGTIHTDFEKHFIKAEVVAYDDFKALQTVKGMGEVRAAGKLRQEGKSYIIQDGDIVHFMIGK